MRGEHGELAAELDVPRGSSPRVRGRSSGRHLEWVASLSHVSAGPVTWGDAGLRWCGAVVVVSHPWAPVGGGAHPSRAWCGPDCGAWVRIGCPGSWSRANVGRVVAGERAASFERVVHDPVRALSVQIGV